MGKSWEGLTRVCTTLWFFSYLALKILPQLAITTICAADAFCTLALYAVFSPYKPGEKLQKSWENYTFRKSLLDIVFVSAARGALLFTAYLVCTVLKPRIVSLWRNQAYGFGYEASLPLLPKHYGGGKTRNKGSTEYLCFTYFLCFCSLGFIVAKATCYDYAMDAKLYSNFRGFGAVLMLVSVGLAALCVFCAKTFDIMTRRRKRLQLVTHAGSHLRDMSGLGGATPRDHQAALPGGGFASNAREGGPLKLKVTSQLESILDRTWAVSVAGGQGEPKPMMVESYEDGYHGYDTMVGRQAHSFPRAAGPGTGADEDVDSPRDQFNYTSAQDSEAKALMDSHLPLAPSKEGGAAWEGSEGSGAESKFANLSPLTIHYNDFASPGSGDQDGEAVVILHGFYGNVSCWTEVATEVARRSGKRVVVFDRVGFGLSSRPLRGEGVAGAGAGAGKGRGPRRRTKEEKEEALVKPYTSHAHAQVFLCLCRTLGIRRAHVVAHDDAAAVALLLSDGDKRAALAEPLGFAPAAGSLGAEVASVALVHPNMGGDVVSKLMEHFLTSSIKAEACMHLVRIEVEVALRRQCCRSSAITPGRMQFYKRPLHLNHWERALRYSVRAIRADRERESARIDLAAREGSDQDPNLLVATGAHDSISRPEDLGGAVKCHIFEDCGHLSHEECPEALVEVLASFLAKV